MNKFEHSIISFEYVVECKNLYIIVSLVHNPNIMLYSDQFLGENVRIYEHIYNVNHPLLHLNTFDEESNSV
jgi:hypothetical protein